jgi:hypothetical protein
MYIVSTRECVPSSPSKKNKTKLRRRELTTTAIPPPFVNDQLLPSAARVSSHSAKEVDASDGEAFVSLGGGFEPFVARGANVWATAIHAVVYIAVNAGGSGSVVLFGGKASGGDFSLEVCAHLT